MNQPSVVVFWVRVAEGAGGTEKWAETVVRLKSLVGCTSFHLPHTHDLASFPSTISAALMKAVGQITALTLEL